MATILEDSKFDPQRDLKTVGSNPVKHDGLDKVTGRAKFGADFFLPGMLFGGRCAAHTRTRLLSQLIPVRLRRFPA